MKKSFFDFSYRYIILCDNDRMTDKIKEEMFGRIKRYLFPKRHEFLDHFIRRNRGFLCKRNTIKLILIFMYENICFEKENSFFYEDYICSKEIDSFTRLIYKPHKNNMKNFIFE
jgi:hypothetical protein